MSRPPGHAVDGIGLSTTVHMGYSATGVVMLRTETVLATAGATVRDAVRNKVRDELWERR